MRSESSTIAKRFVAWVVVLRVGATEVGGRSAMMTSTWQAGGKSGTTSLIFFHGACNGYPFLYQSATAIWRRRNLLKFLCSSIRILRPLVFWSCAHLRIRCFWRNWFAAQMPNLPEFRRRHLRIKECSRSSRGEKSIFDWTKLKNIMNILPWRLVIEVEI